MHKLTTFQILVLQALILILRRQSVRVDSVTFDGYTNDWVNAANKAINNGVHDA